MPDFIAPTHDIPLGTGPLFGRFLVAEPSSLVRDSDGNWTVQVQPSIWVLEVASAYYLGGYDKPITEEHLQEIKDQGLPGVWYWRAYGEGPYGGGDYGG